MNLFLDTETIPSQTPAHWVWIDQHTKPPANMSKAETIEKWERFGRADDVAKAIRQTSLDAAFGELYCIGLAADDEAPFVLVRRDLSPEAEVSLLREFVEAVLDLADGTQVNWIGHYLLDFDAPFLARRGYVRGLRFPFAFPWNWHNGAGCMVDTRRLWTGNLKDHVGLDKLCCALGIECLKGDFDGSKAWDAVQAGEGQKVCDYCADDVTRTREIWKRLTWNGEVAA